MSIMRERIEELEKRRHKIKQMGGPEKIKKQHDRGKLTARERLDLFYDNGKFVELGLHGTEMGTKEKGEKPPADAVITVWGKVNDRYVATAAYDFTVKGGSMGAVSEEKVTRLRELALRCRIPMVWLIDSAGARIDPNTGGGGDSLSLFAGAGHLFREESIMSGVIPLISAMVGPGAAGTAYIPGLADFVPMTKDKSSMALGGPPLVKAATGQIITEQELGGSKIHTTKSGVGDAEVKDDESCIQIVKDYLSYMPQHCEEKPPIIDNDDPIDRRDENLVDLIPDNPRSFYNMYDVIKTIVDHGDYLDIKQKWARSIITCFARFNGHPCGIVANNPKQFGGILTSEAADKAAHFIQICDAFNIPLLFLMDVPGFMIGSHVEHEGIIRHGAKMLHAMASATVPKLTVVTRKGYGAGYFVMAGRAFEPDLIVAWPGAEISVMGAAGMVEIAAPKMFGKTEPAPELKAQVAQMIQKYIDIYRVAGWGLIDDVIDPRETRSILCQAIEMSWNRTVERPYRKHGVMPV